MFAEKLYQNSFCLIYLFLGYTSTFCCTRTIACFFCYSMIISLFFLVLLSNRLLQTTPLYIIQLWQTKIMIHKYFINCKLYFISTTFQIFWEANKPSVLFKKMWRSAKIFIFYSKWIASLSIHTMPRIFIWISNNCTTSMTFNSTESASSHSRIPEKVRMEWLHNSHIYIHLFIQEDWALVSIINR